jgi:hypothetical protein
MLRDVQKLRLPENRELRAEFGPESEDVAGALARMGEMRSAFRVLVGKLDGKRPLGKTRCRCEDNI